ncbi:hypothetical protein TSAR_004662 [Trichomalopsis sarcophagae]|uniref:Uncharacterized protein n=1 Tax=Trichomalopsis sarcophagae TaxID=543379 RepID=A0A232EDL5_9HYME|nr:hypothetical protein TSAR_004662 [Trichomalopsis sarcophagae]
MQISLQAPGRKIILSVRVWRKLFLK